MRSDHAFAPQAQPNVTPMIDVLLVLLILFMLLVPLSRRSLDVQLPDPSRTAADGPPPIVLEVGPGGALAVNRQAVGAGELGAYLRRLYAGRPDKVLLVRGDDAATYQEVVAAMDSARGAGVRVLGMMGRR